MHCAAADFDIHDGVMESTRFFIDSEQVFISGEGRVLLDSEALDLKLHGEPKGLRFLRLKAPVRVQGTLLLPKFRVDAAELGVATGGPRHAARRRLRRAASPLSDRRPLACYSPYSRLAGSETASASCRSPPRQAVYSAPKRKMSEV